MSGLPKWTKPVSIAAYSITSLPIDIIAQTIGNISIDIAAQSLGNINVNIAASAVTINVATAIGEHIDTDIISSIQLDINIAASAVTLDINIASQAAFNITVDIAAQSVGNLNINIAASAISLNIKTTVGEHVDTDIISSITLNVDVVAQSVGNILIDIAAQSVGNISINIAASAISLNVKTTGAEHVDTDIVSSITLNVDIVAQTVGNIAIDIAAQSVGNISINIAASAISLNVKTTGAEHVDTDIVSSITLNVDIVAQTVGNIAIDIAAQSVGNISINIAASAISLNVTTTVGEHVDTDIVSSITLNVDITAQTVGNIAIDIAAQTIGNLNVNIAASAVTINVQTAVGQHVDTDIISSIQLDINIAASAVTLNVNISSQSAFNMNVDIAEQSVGNLNINLAASAITLDVDIAAQTVDLNIKTSGGTNIIIDKLTQAAYTERRSTLINSGVQTFEEAPTGDLRRGKIFPRGARGFIYRIFVYSRNPGASTQTITVYIAPYIGAGYLYTGTITLLAGTTWGWYYWTLNKMWNYDSMFMFAVVSSSDVKIGKDIGTPYDHYRSSDAGVTWEHDNARLHFKIDVNAETVGDIPVSGTLNTIGIPNLAGSSASANLSVDAGATEYHTTVYGIGWVTLIFYHTNSVADRDGLNPRLEIDGSNYPLLMNDDIAAYELFLLKLEVGCQSFAITKYDTVNHHYALQVTLRIPFRRSFRVGFYNKTAGALDGDVIYCYEKLT